MPTEFHAYSIKFCENHMPPVAGMISDKLAREALTGREYV